MRSFVEFMNEQYKMETQGFGTDYSTLMNECDVGTLGMIWFTIAVKLAIESNNPNSKFYNQNQWTYEVDAMLTAYYRTGHITATEYCKFRNTFYHWMRCNYRMKRYELKR